MKPDIKPELQKLIQAIGTKSMFYGNPVPPSILALLTIEETENNCGILAPFWIGVLQRGRGPRRSNKSYGLSKIIYKWMEKRGMFRSDTAKGKQNEARFMTLYINKYGNAHFRSGRYIDIYDTERKKTIAEIDRKFSLMIGKITMDVI